MDFIIIIGLGAFLALADWVAIDTGRRFGRKRGTMVWVAAVLFPLLASAWLFPWEVSLGAALLATAFSGLAFWCKRQDQRGASASWLYKLL